MRKLILFVGIVLSFIASQEAMAALNIELTQGVAAAIPIAIVPFTQDGQVLPTDITTAIRNDLGNSGQFNVLASGAANQFPHTVGDVNTDYWRSKNVDDLVVGHVNALGNGQYQVSFSLINLFNQAPNNVLLTQEYTVNQSELRGVAHHISDLIYQQLTGVRGIFSTKLAYVLVQRTASQAPQFKLMVSDADGYNAKPILISSQPIMSPAWSPDGQQISYVSFESYLPQIYVSTIANGQRRLITSFSGINGAPEWSPDGKNLAVALSKGGANPNIYMLSMSSGKLTQLTNDWSINTEPSWSKDGQTLLFTSDRGGSPQIYEMNLQTKAVQRLTFDGTYNASASFTSDGQNVVLLNRQSGQFNIGLLNLQSGNLQLLTRGGMNQSPSVAPNGKMVVYATKVAGKNLLAMVSTDGKVNMQLPDQQGDVQEPAWSPFLN
ncbi:MAG: Tol-Pal system beta propeller repeat protein TolB [Gammaproteobacteria bacterium]|nr:Tol-Pal system beta propeller repeat protein TolB [Gammaproteobacteria bacterium]